MKSKSGNYSTTIRKCKDGSYNIEIFAIYDHGIRMGLNGHQGVSSLEEAREISVEWMAEYESQNEARAETDREKVA